MINYVLLCALEFVHPTLGAVHNRLVGREERLSLDIQHKEGSIIFTNKTKRWVVVVPSASCSITLSEENKNE